MCIKNISMFSLSVDWSKFKKNPEYTNRKIALAENI